MHRQRFDGDTLYYVGNRPGAWPPPEPGDLEPITTHVVRARLVETPVGADADRWRVEQLETTRALSLAYLEVMADQLRSVRAALEEVREDSTGGTR